jgi:hypothetical protein
MAPLKNFFQTSGLQETKNFLGVNANGTKNFLDTTEGQQYTNTLQEQKDELLDVLVKYVGGQKNGRSIITSLNQIENIIMTQCAKIANTPGCC